MSVPGYDFYATACFDPTSCARSHWVGIERKGTIMKSLESFEDEAICQGDRMLRQNMEDLYQTRS